MRSSQIPGCVGQVQCAVQAGAYVAGSGLGAHEQSQGVPVGVLVEDGVEGEGLAGPWLAGQAHHGLFLDGGFEGLGGGPHL